jgi:tetratricopeptide (TPR) repeat protein
MRLLAASKFKAAISALRQATELDARSAEAHHALGQALLHTGRFTEAVDSLRLATILNDRLAAAHCDLAAALDGLGRNREAIAACRRAIELAPLVPDSHRALGELLESAGNAGEAAQCFLRAASAAPDTTTSRLDSVRALMLQDNLPEAEACLRQAIALDSRNDELHKVLGEVLAKEGRFTDAIEACDRAVELNPLQVPAFLTAVRASRCTDADRPRLARMLSTLHHPSINDAHRVYLHFAIGKFLDDIGEYREAMRHFDRANGIRGRNKQFDRAALGDVITRLIQRYTSDFFAANRAFGLSAETPLFIVGMPRSGTTLVEQIVSSHPEIAAGEELFFWSRRASSRGIAEATSLTPESGRALAAEYLAELRHISPSAARVTDKQTFNFQQLGLIHLLLPNARIIHCRRHPIDTCLSMYCTYFKGQIPFVASRSDLAFAYRQYLRIMSHWRAVLPRDRFFEIDYEALVAEREELTRKLIAFTGLGWNDACLQPERNVRTVTTASLWQARQPVFRTSVERWRRYEPWLGELRQLLADPDALPRA